MHTLVSFLGKSQLDRNTGYRRARYRFPDGGIRETPFFGLSLADYLRPDAMLILGTAGSMWPALVEFLPLEGNDELRLELIDASEAGAVSQALLDQIEPLLGQHFGFKVRPRLIPYASSFEDQLAILDIVADEVKTGEVSFDVTHGFRHLAMLGMLSALMLTHARRLAVKGLWYGALDMTGRDPGITPVLALDGLLGIEQWLSAFVRLDASGDFSAFAPLLCRDGLDELEAKRLERAWLALNQTNVQDAVRELRPLLERLESPLSGASELFRKRLQERLKWCRKPDLAGWQHALALQALQRGDILRASVFGLEAFLSRATHEMQGDPLRHEDRERADQAFRQELKDDEHPDWKREAYWLLKNVRNACAHGTVPRFRKHAELMKNPERLRRELEATLNRMNNT
ncbi:TIGR02221 family CRISPR-associated protein [Rehaibacterium terrae]|uniref:CRISPR-associated Csx2 family protein n=1 Tax=Rehaibacterium terrae TaxID=1341696 RepID=A0A7W7Y0K6_9GAMM|nr:CRISPR-associated Csx2 family protein [Rehaibacterium terrae]